MVAVIFVMLSGSAGTVSRPRFALERVLRREILASSLILLSGGVSGRGAAPDGRPRRDGLVLNRHHEYLSIFLGLLIQVSPTGSPSRKTRIWYSYCTLDLLAFEGRIGSADVIIRPQCRIMMRSVPFCCDMQCRPALLVFFWVAGQ